MQLLSAKLVLPTLLTGAALAIVAAATAVSSVIVGLLGLGNRSHRRSGVRRQLPSVRPGSPYYLILPWRGSSLW